jgi:hypothetical protein
MHKEECSCHCGAVSVRFETTDLLSSLRPRACQCDHCRMQGARYLSDPNGQLVLQAKSDDAFFRYQFGMKTADFLTCKSCGVLIGAVCTVDDDLRMVINANLFLNVELGGNVATDSSGENLDDRNARREAAWTPVDIICQ